MRLRALASLLTVGAISLSLGACAGKVDYSADLFAAVARTQVQSYSFDYRESHSGHVAHVTGSVEDDLRYQTSYTLDSQPIVDEVVKDDARALRMPLPGTVDRVAPTAAPPVQVVLGDPGPLTATKYTVLGLPLSSTVAADRPPADTLDALRKGGWVLDPVGAGPMRRQRPTDHTPDVGEDIVRDALTELQNAQQLAKVSNSVRKFNPEDLEYRADQDPFPRPDSAHGEVRYDLPLPGLNPRASVTETTPTQRLQALPGPNYFRQYSIYVRNGIVEKIVESTNVERRLLLPDQDILSRFTDAGIPVPSQVQHGSRAAQAAFIEKELVRVESSVRQPLLRVREMTLTISGLGKPVVTAVPDGTTRASLGRIVSRGLVLGQA